MPIRWLPAVALSALILNACAPTATTPLTNLLGPKTPDRSGPLIVGQTWAISGVLSGTTPISKTLPVPQLVAQSNAKDLTSKGTVSVSDQALAEQVPSADYQFVAYTNNDQSKQVRFVWNGNVTSERVERYECRTPYNGSVPLRGVLTLQFQGSPTAQRGTCTATPTDPPPVAPTTDQPAPAPEQPQTPATPASP